MYRLFQLKRKINSSNAPAKYIIHFTHVLNHNSVDKLSFNVNFETVKPTNRHKAVNLISFQLIFDYRFRPNSFPS